jgi:hypothetical protein
VMAGKGAFAAKEPITSIVSQQIPEHNTPVKVIDKALTELATQRVLRESLTDILRYGRLELPGESPYAPIVGLQPRYFPESELKSSCFKESPARSGCIRVRPPPFI